MLKMKLFSRMAFKTKVLLLSAFLVVAPITVCSIVVYSSFRIELAQKDYASLTSESARISELMVESYQWNLNETLLHLANLRINLSEQTTIIKSSLLQAMTFQDSSLTRMVGGYLLNSICSGKLRVFITPKGKPEESIFLSESDRKFLYSISLRGDSDFAHFLSKYQRFEDDSEFYLFKIGQNPYLVCIRELNSEMIICAFRDISNLQSFYSDATTMKDIIIDLSSNINVILSEQLASQTAVKIINSDFNEEYYSVGFDFSVRDIPIEYFMKARNGKTFQISHYIKDKFYYIAITYFSATGWYLIVISDPRVSEAALRDDLQEVFLLSALLLVISILFGSSLLKKSLIGLSYVAKKAEQVEKTTFKDPSELIELSKDFPNMSNDEIGILSNTFRDMTLSIAKNMNMLLAEDAERESHNTELLTAKRIQDGVLINDLENRNYKPLTIDAQLITAKEVGGDLYDVIELDDDRVALIIGDVSDKGVPSALFMGMAMIVIRLAVSMGLSPREVMKDVNQALGRRNPNMMFITLFIGFLNKKTGEIVYSNGGHLRPVIADKNGYRLLEGLSGPAVGVTDFADYNEFNYQLDSDCSIMFYTDGVSEALNESEELYSDERLYSFMESHYAETPADINKHLIENIIEFRKTAPQSDDITILTVNYKKGEV